MVRAPISAAVNTPSLLLLLIVLLGLLALLPVAWASGRVSRGAEEGSGAGVLEDFGTGTASRAFSGLGLKVLHNLDDYKFPS